MPTGRPARRAASEQATASSSGWPGAVGRDTVEEQVVDRGREHNGFEVRAGAPGQRMQLTDAIAVARADEPCREVVERAVGAGGPHGHELGREREGEVARG
jgi:hypothetical protein